MNLNNNDIGNLIQELNQLFKKIDNIYYKIAKKNGLSATAFWIIYAIKNEKEVYKQKDLCNMWSYSKQTINTALKKLEGDNIIKLLSMPNNKKDKKIVLTEKGELIAKNFINPVNEIEQKILENMKERDKFILLFTEYVEELNKKVELLIKDKEDV